MPPAPPPPRYPPAPPGRTSSTRAVTKLGVTVSGDISSFSASILGSTIASLAGVDETTLKKKKTVYDATPGE